MSKNEVKPLPLVEKAKISLKVVATVMFAYIMFAVVTRRHIVNVRIVAQQESNNQWRFEIVPDAAIDLEKFADDKKHEEEEGAERSDLPWWQDPTDQKCTEEPQTKNTDTVEPTGGYERRWFNTDQQVQSGCLQKAGHKAVLVYTVYGRANPTFWAKFSRILDDDLTSLSDSQVILRTSPRYIKPQLFVCELLKKHDRLSICDLETLSPTPMDTRSDSLAKADNLEEFGISGPSSKDLGSETMQKEAAEGAWARVFSLLKARLRE